MSNERIDVQGYKLQIGTEDCFGSDWTVWLNTEVDDYDGICIGAGDSRDAAVADAVKVLKAAVEALQAPPREETVPTLATCTQSF